MFQKIYTTDSINILKPRFIGAFLMSVSSWKKL